MARLLVMGRRGQLATTLAQIETPGFEICFSGRDQCDVTRAEAIDAALALHAPSLVINTAAYTAVDRAETDANSAYALNRDAAVKLAQACERRSLALIHLSTDYVFDGAKGAPYVEDDTVNPLNVYGLSKAAGETAVLASGARACVLRSSWVFSMHGANFLTAMRARAEQEEVRVVADQMGTPTWAEDLARACLSVGQALLDGAPQAEGLMHFANAGAAHWAAFAEAIFASTPGAKARVRRITAAEYGAPARRPADSRLDCARIGNRLGVTPRPWSEALARCLKSETAN